MLWLQLVMVSVMLSYGGDDYPPWLGALSTMATATTCDDMLWMQLVKVGNVFDR